MYYRLYFNSDTICISSNKESSDKPKDYVASEDFYLRPDYNPIGRSIREIYDTSRHYIKIVREKMDNKNREDTLNRFN